MNERIGKKCIFISASASRLCHEHLHPSYYVLYCMILLLLLLLLCPWYMNMVLIFYLGSGRTHFSVLCGPAYLHIYSMYVCVYCAFAIIIIIIIITESNRYGTHTYVADDGIWTAMYDGVHCRTHNIAKLTCNLICERTSSGHLKMQNR